MIEVTEKNTFDYFDEKVVDEIFNAINIEINKFIAISPNTGLGCICLPNIPVKKVGNRNVYVEYHYEIVGNRDRIPIPIKLKPHSVIIFEGMPTEIQDKIETVSRLINDYSKLN